MYELDAIIKFFETEDLYNYSIDENRIKEMYNLISNPNLRVNDADKQWVAYTSQASEVATTVTAIKEILGYAKAKALIEDYKVTEATKMVGDIFIHSNIDMKPRIPFYIMVLDKLKD